MPISQRLRWRYNGAVVKRPGHPNRNRHDPNAQAITQLLWHHGWAAPPVSTIPADVFASTNIMTWAMGQSAQGGTGNITSPPNSDVGYTSAAAKVDIANWVSAGKKVLYGIGGASDGGITITNETQVAQARNSLNLIFDEWGFNGFNLDLEPSGSSWNQASIVSLIAKLKADHGPGFHVDVCVGLYGEYIASWTALGRALGDNMDSMSVMLYDFPEAGDGRLTWVTLDKIATMLEGGIPVSKQIMLYMMRPDPGYLNATHDPQLIVDAMNTAYDQYPTLLGYGWWEDYINASRDWDGPRAVMAGVG